MLVCRLQNRHFRAFFHIVAAEVERRSFKGDNSVLDRRGFASRDYVAVILAAAGRNRDYRYDKNNRERACADNYQLFLA